MSRRGPPPIGPLSPQPGRSSAMHLKSGSLAMSDIQLVPAFATPWINTTGGPSPVSCTRTISPVRSRARHSLGFTPGRFPELPFTLPVAVEVRAHGVGLLQRRLVWVGPHDEPACG